MQAGASPAPKTARVFISYSRTDGSPIARQLATLLSEANHPVWLDVDNIRGGDNWTNELDSALSHCDVLLAVLTEGSYKSGICRSEQLFGMEHGKRVIPILAAPTVPRPTHLYGLNYRNFPNDQQALLVDLGLSIEPSPLQQNQRLYRSVPDLPANFIPREDAIAKLQALVFTEQENHSAALTAVAGMGGIGKSVLAAALCHHPAVRRAFPDGIAWITLGREWNGDAASAMRHIVTALGENLSAAADALTCQTRYQNIVQEKAVLIVLDDVWNLAHLQPLLLSAPRARFLFTTRDVGIVKAVSAREHQADLLSPVEGRRLLALSADLEIERLPAAADPIVQECRGLALAIAQIGGTLRNTTAIDWNDTLESLRRADVSALEELLPPGQVSFFKGLAVSLDRALPRMQERYRLLATALEDAAIHSDILQTLWEVNAAEARRTCRYFVERSLATWESSGDPDRGIRLHDLQLDYIRAAYPERSALPLIHQATRLSAHVIDREPRQYASQLTGRLLAFSVAGIPEFLDRLRRGAPKPWFRPLRQSLHPPDTELLRTLEGHSARVTSVALTPDGKRAVSASADYTLRVWDLESGRVLRTLEGHSGSVTSVALTADGKRAVSASADYTLKVWDLESGRVLHTLEGHSDSATSVALTADGKRAVSGSYDKTLKVWELESGRALRTLEGHSAPVTSVAVPADGKRAVSVSGDNTLRAWDLESGRALCTLEGHSAWVNSVAVTADGKRAVSGSYDKTLKVWDLESWRVLHTVKGHSGSVNGVTLTADGKHAVSASDDCALKVWDLKSGRASRALNGHSASVASVALTAGGKRAVSASEDCTLKVWDLESGRASRTLDGHSSVVTSVALTADGKRAVSASYDDTLRVWDLESGRALCTLEGHSAPVTSVALTADGKRAVSASGDNTLRGWDLESGRALCTLGGHSAWVNSVALTADGKCAVSASYDKTLKVWDLESRRALLTLEGHSLSVGSVALTADGRCAVSASHDKTLKLWDLETGFALHTLEGHSHSVNSVGLMADGTRAVSASEDKTLKLWDLESGRALATFYADAAARCCACCSGLVAMGDAVGQVHLLQLEEDVKDADAGS